MKHAASALSVMHCEQGQARANTLTHTHTHTHTFTYAHAVSVTHPHTRTPSHCAAPSHTYTHTPSHVCAEAERCLLLRLFLGLSLKHTWTHTVQLDSTEPDRTTVTHQWRLSHEQRQYSIYRKARLPASTPHLSYSPSPHLFSLPPSLSPSIHSSLILPAVRRHAWLKDTALGSAVV